ncbi:MAG TPA: anaerobic glycerol-3-phosphate dehydrogenase subunit C [Symbiobacteriaceae bacterium]|nr:anaerobic glycerol-3-phosphate dehydrogenase subunit C [Symbiobacteriaceae bacterium]
METSTHFDACLKCSLCTEHCPVSRVLPSFPGPKQLGPDHERWRLETGAYADANLSLCTGCQRCEMACPSGVKITALIQGARNRSRQRRKLGDRYIADTDLLGRLGALAPGAANFATGLKPVRLAMQGLLGLSARRPLPRFTRRPYRVDPRHRAPAGSRSVVFFMGCYARYYDPDLADAVVAVLEYNGFQVIIPKQECCGLPLLANGFPEKAGEKAACNLAHLDEYTRAGIPVVAVDPSCALMLKADYQELLGEKAAAFGAQVHELGAFLRGLWEEGELNLDFGPLDETLAYHEPCHLRPLGTGRPFVEVLRLIPGLRVAELDEGCCGMAGTYGMKARNLETSLAVGHPLFHKVREMGTRVITECEMCMMQIQFGTGMEALHPIKILRNAYAAGIPAVASTNERKEDLTCEHQLG